MARLPDPRASAAFLATLRPAAWVVYAKPPFSRPAQVLEYLGRYTYRVAISNDRLLSLTDGIVRCRWKAYADGDRVKVLALPAAACLRRFLLHVVPHGFVRIHPFGLLAHRGRTAKLARCRVLLATAPPPAPAPPESVAARILRVTGVDLTRCPVCRAGRLRVVGRLPPGALPVPVVDTS
ncbi:MAG: transposase [Candidatus Rokubacteria bacterium]|nr:transposase [Candidatus Rokubacteria bacterium]